MGIPTQLIINIPAFKQHPPPHLYRCIQNITLSSIPHCIDVIIDYLYIIILTSSSTLLLHNILGAFVSLNILGTFSTVYTTSTIGST